MYYNDYEPLSILTQDQVDSGWGINKKGNPVPPHKYNNMAKPITGKDDPRTVNALKALKEKGDRQRDRKRLEEELRDFKRDAIRDAKARVENGESTDAVTMLQQSLLDIEALLERTKDESTYNKLLDTKIKYINAYANLTLGGVASTSIQEAEVNEPLTQEDLDKKFAEFNGKFEVVEGGKK